MNLILLASVTFNFEHNGLPIIEEKMNTLKNKANILNRK